MSLARFCETFSLELAKAHASHPDEYYWPTSEMPDVIRRMHDAFKRRSFNKESRAIKATCKALRIKHTYTAIHEFMARSS